MLKRYIITGAPGTGKTSLVNALRKNKFTCFEEVSRRIIKEEQKVKGDKTPWQDIEGFTKLVYKQTIKELSIPINNIAFVDRGMADNIAYLKLRGINISSLLINFKHKKFYDTTVFMLPPWKEIYVVDSQRLQSYEEALKLHELLLEIYLDLGFKVKTLPKTSIFNRVELIEAHINSST